MMVTDRFGNELKKADNKPTLEQSLNSWDLVNELVELSYCHNFQHERSDIVSWIEDASMIIDKAIKIVKGERE